MLKENPADPEAACAVGLNDLKEARKNAVAALMKAGFNDDGSGNAKAPVKVTVAIKEQNSLLAEEAQENLLQAVKNGRNYAEAMSYLNLVYRRKADLDWDNDAARADDLAKAREWADKAKETRGLDGEMVARPGSAQP